jgi:hypothetical protein
LRVEKLRAQLFHARYRRSSCPASKEAGSRGRRVDGGISSEERKRTMRRAARRR